MKQKVKRYLFLVFFWINVALVPFILYIYRRATVFLYLLFENFFKDFESYREYTMGTECAFLCLYVLYMTSLVFVYLRTEHQIGTGLGGYITWFLISNFCAFMLAYCQLYR